MGIQSILDRLDGTLDLARSLAGPAATLGLPGAGLVKAALDIAENLKDRVSEGAVVATGEQAARIDQIIADLQEQNDALADRIANS